MAERWEEAAAVAKRWRWEEAERWRWEEAGAAQLGRGARLIRWVGGRVPVADTLPFAEGYGSNYVYYLQTTLSVRNHW